MKTSIDKHGVFSQNANDLIEKYSLSTDGVVPAACPKYLFKEAMKIATVKIRRFHDKIHQQETDMMLIKLALIQPSLMKFKKVEQPFMFMDPEQNNLRKIQDELIPSL